MWNPDVKLARSFLAVAQEKSVTAAARLLNSTQPTVSGHLKELESQLDFTLFERSTRRVELTIEGTKILPAFARLIECADEIECSMKQIRSTKRDTFRLAATMYTIDIPERTELLDGFDNEFPRIGYSVENYLQSEQVPKLIAGLLDVSLLLGCQVTADQYEKIQCNVDKAAVANELQYPDSLECMVIGTRDIQLLVPEESHLAEFDIIPATALQGWTISMLGPGHGAMLTDPIIAFLQKYGAQVYVPADTNAVAVNRYAWLHRIPSVDLGWHGKPSGHPGEMVRLPVEGLEMSTQFAVVMGSKPSAAASKFFHFSKRFVNDNQYNSTNFL